MAKQPTVFKIEVEGGRQKEVQLVFDFALKRNGEPIEFYKGGFQFLVNQSVLRHNSGQVSKVIEFTHPEV